MSSLMSLVHLVARRVIFVCLRNVRHLTLKIVSSVTPNSIMFFGSETSSVRSLTAQELFNPSLTRRCGRPDSVFLFLLSFFPKGRRGAPVIYLLVACSLSPSWQLVNTDDISSYLTQVAHYKTGSDLIDRLTNLC